MKNIHSEVEQQRAPSTTLEQALKGAGKLVTVGSKRVSVDKNIQVDALQVSIEQEPPVRGAKVTLAPLNEEDDEEAAYIDGDELESLIKAMGSIHTCSGNAAHPYPAFELLFTTKDGLSVGLRSPDPKNMQYYIAIRENEVGLSASGVSMIQADLTKAFHLFGS